jgi:hypothetical protein
MHRASFYNMYINQQDAYTGICDVELIKVAPDDGII